MDCQELTVRLLTVQLFGLCSEDTLRKYEGIGGTWTHPWEDALEISTIRDQQISTIRNQPVKGRRAFERTTTVEAGKGVNNFLYVASSFFGREVRRTSSIAQPCLRPVGGLVGADDQIAKD